jgi:hypothetical protein
MNKYRLKYDKKGGIEAWVGDLKYYMEEFDCERTREHMKDKVVLDGSSRIHLYRLWEVRRALSDVVRTQKYENHVLSSRSDDFIDG